MVVSISSHKGLQIGALPQGGRAALSESISRACPIAAIAVLIPYLTHHHFNPHWHSIRRLWPFMAVCLVFLIIFLPVP
jgi:hypothetical protein